MSTLKVDGIRSNSATSDAITLASDGTCTANITNNLSNRNIVTNGAMLVAQRSTSSTDQLYSTVDRMRAARVNVSDNPTFAQATLSLGGHTVTPYLEGHRKAFKITNGNQAGSNTNSVIAFSTRLEAQDIASSGWNYTDPNSFITLQFWVKSSVAQNFYVRLFTQDGTQKNYPMETGTLTADVWKKVTKKIPGHADLQFDNDNQRGLDIDFSAFRGTQQTASGVTLDQWSALDDTAKVPDMTQTWYTTNDATFMVTGIQLEVGDHATDFEHRSYGDELARCQRYYAMFKGDTTAFRLGLGMTSTATNANLCIHLPVTMRYKPTYLDHNGTVGNYQVHQAAIHNATALSVHTQSTPNMAFITMTSSGMTTNAVFKFRSSNTNAFIGVGCDL